MAQQIHPSKRRRALGENSYALNSAETPESDFDTTDSSSESDDEKKSIPDRRWKKSVTRKREKRPGLKTKENLSPTAITDALKKHCCNFGCLKKFSGKEVERLRKEFWGMVTKDQTSWIIQQIRSTHAFQEQCHEPRFCVEGRYICVKGWQLLYAIKKSRFYKHRRAAEKGHIDGTDGRLGMGYCSIQYVGVTLFLSDYAKKFGEVMPDNDQVHLPSCVTKKTAYDDYLYDTRKENKKPLSYVHFRRIWCKEFPHVKTTKVKRFTKCKMCCAFKEALLMKVSKEELEKLRAQKKAHLLLQKICREKYYKHIKKSKGNPEKYLSLIIDNMDQSKTRLPRFEDTCKGEENNHSLHHHVTGVLNHGQGKNYVYTWTDKFPGDTNITINCLLSVFDDAKNREGRLPETLYLQADNAAKDNKNFIMVAFLAALVKQEIFKKVKLSFLMVGHTHEDVDQMFSCISRRLGKNSTPTVPDLHREIRLSHTPVPTVHQFSDIWDYRQGVVESGKKLAGHQAPHVFTIRKTNEKVVLNYKDWPLKSSEYQQLDITDLADRIPATPAPVNPSAKFSEEIDSMEVGLKKWERQGRFPKPSLLWWRSYLTSLRKPSAEPEVPTLTNFNTFIKTSATPGDIPEELLAVFEKEMQKTQKHSKVRMVNT